MKWTIKGVWNHQAGNLLQPLQKYSKEEIKTHWRLGKWNITGKSGICAWLGGKFGPQQRRFFHSHCCKSQTPIIDSNFTIPSESLVVIQSGSKHAIVCYVGICQDSVLYPTFGWWKSWSKRSSTLGLKKNIPNIVTWVTENRASEFQSIFHGSWLILIPLISSIFSFASTKTAVKTRPLRASCTLRWSEQFFTTLSHSMKGMKGSGLGKCPAFSHRWGYDL